MATRNLQLHMILPRASGPARRFVLHLQLMNSEEALRYALGKPGAWLDSPWGEDHHVAKVGSKIFLFPGTVDGRSTIAVKNSEAAVAELKQRYPDLAGPARYLNKRLWVLLIIDAVPYEEVVEL